MDLLSAFAIPTFIDSVLCRIVYKFIPVMNTYALAHVNHVSKRNFNQLCISGPILEEMLYTNAYWTFKEEPLQIIITYLSLATQIITGHYSLAFLSYATMVSSDTKYKKIITIISRISAGILFALAHAINNSLIEKARVLIMHGTWQYLKYKVTKDASRKYGKNLRYILPTTIHIVHNSLC